MKRIFLLISFISLSLLTFARPTVDDVSPAFKEHVREVLKQYIEVKSALVTADTKNITTSTNRLIKIVRTFDVTQLAPEEKTFYESQAAVLITEAIAMENERDVEAQREHFKSVSVAMVELVKGNNYDEKVAQASTRNAEGSTSRVAEENNGDMLAAKSTSKAIRVEKTKPADAGAVMCEDGQRKIKLCYCPIAKAYWLSYDDEADHKHNPYAPKLFKSKAASDK